jgi:lysophospholipase L1-like esterase
VGGLGVEAGAYSKRGGVSTIDDASRTTRGRSMASRVLLIGDSIRMGYVPGVRERLLGRAEIAEIPENGGDSANLLDKLSGWLDDLADDPPAVAYVNCGLHDIKRAYASDARQVGLVEYRANVRSILALLTERMPDRTVWASTTPVVYERHHARKGFDRFDADVLDYNAAAASVAMELGVPVHDLYRAVADDDVMECVGEDGVHMTARGNALLAEHVAKRLHDYI